LESNKSQFLFIADAHEGLIVMNSGL